MSEDFNRKESFEEKINEEELSEAQQQAVEKEIHKMEQQASGFQVIPDEPDKQTREKNSLITLLNSS